MALPETSRRTDNFMLNVQRGCGSSVEDGTDGIDEGMDEREGVCCEGEMYDERRVGKRGRRA